RIGAVDQGPYLSSLEQWPDLRLKVCGDRGLEGDRAGSQGGAGDRQALYHDLLKVQFGLRPAQEGDEDEPTVWAQQAHVTRHVVAAHHVEDEVRALALLRFGGGGSNCFHEVFFAVVDGPLRTQSIG